MYEEKRKWKKSNTTRKTAIFIPTLHCLNRRITKLASMATFTLRNNPAISERNRKNGSFDFDSKIQLSANGSVGTKINFSLNYNTEATFNADQKLINLNYKGEEDDIIQRIEAGNVRLPLSSSLITGSTDLFGFRTDLQFGKLKVAAIISQQESERKTISTQGAQTTFPKPRITVITHAERTKLCHLTREQQLSTNIIKK